MNLAAWYSFYTLYVDQQQRLMNENVYVSQEKLWFTTCRVRTEIRSFEVKK